jgi:hypothetical protein
LLTVRRRAAQIPTGTPVTVAMTAVTMTMLSVCMV